MNETNEFKPWVRSNWKGWSEAYEPRRGGGTGIADIQILMGDGRLVPIELKVGEVKQDVLWCKDVRPDQLGWHNRFQFHGGKSFFLVGCGSIKRLSIYAVKLQCMLDWKTGLGSGCKHEINVNDFTLDLALYINLHILREK